MTGLESKIINFKNTDDWISKLKDLRSTLEKLETEEWKELGEVYETEYYILEEELSKDFCESCECTPCDCDWGN